MTSEEPKPVVFADFQKAYFAATGERANWKIWRVTCCEKWTFYVVAKTAHTARQAMLDRLDVQASRMTRQEMLDAMAESLAAVKTKEQAPSKESE